MRYMLNMVLLFDAIEINLSILPYLLIIPKSVHRKAYTPWSCQVHKRQKSTIE